MLSIVRVDGNSMNPTLSNGDFVICYPWVKKAELNTLLIADHPSFGTIIKRVIGVNADGSFWLDSDNANGMRTERIGLLQADSIIGKAIILFRSRQP